MEVDEKPEEKPVRKPSRWAAAFQVVICCGQIPTQSFIAVVLFALGLVPDDGHISLRFFAALTLTDTVVVIALMRMFLKDSQESPFRVFFGPRERSTGFTTSNARPASASSSRPSSSSAPSAWWRY